MALHIPQNAFTDSLFWPSQQSNEILKLWSLSAFYPENTTSPCPVWKLLQTKEITLLLVFLPTRHIYSRIDLLTKSLLSVKIENTFGLAIVHPSGLNTYSYYLFNSVLNVCHVQALCSILGPFARNLLLCLYWDYVKEHWGTCWKT